MTEEVSGIKSKPVYSPLQYDPKSRWSLFIGEGEGLIGLINLLSSSELIRSVTTNLMYTGSDVEKAYAQSYFSPGRCNKISRLENQDALLAELPQILVDSRMGLRLYISGSETFLWKVAGIARAADMHKSEYNMQLIGSTSIALITKPPAKASQPIYTSVMVVVCHLSIAITFLARWGLISAFGSMLKFMEKSQNARSYIDEHRFFLYRTSHSCGSNYTVDKTL
jgi:hypothetical protein